MGAPRALGFALDTAAMRRARHCAGIGTGTLRDLAAMVGEVRCAATTAAPFGERTFHIVHAIGSANCVRGYPSAGAGARLRVIDK